LTHSTRDESPGKEGEGEGEGEGERRWVRKKERLGSWNIEKVE
jgi:hypothetical protein